jgi:hypothetical protein
MRAPLVCLLLFGTVGAPGAQSPAPPKDLKHKDSSVQVRGCLHGSELIVSEDPGFALPGRTLELHANRRLMKSLREHNGHQEEISGVLKTSGHQAVAMKEKRGDKTRVYIGASTLRSGPTDQLAAGPVLEVREVTHLAAGSQ